MRKGWSEQLLGTFMDFKNGVNADSQSYGQGVKFVNVMDIFANNVLREESIIGSVSISEKQAADFDVKYGDILFNRTSETPEDIATASVYIGSDPIVFGGFVIRGRQSKPTLTPEYSSYVFRSDKIRREFIRRGQGAVRSNIGQKDLAKVPILVPPIPEQRRIAEILRTWDDAAEKLKALRAAKVKNTSGILLRLFEEEFASLESLVRAKSVFEPVSERGRSDLPLLAVMQDVGIVRRDKLDRRVAMPNGSTSNYKVVRPKDFVISLRSFEGGLEHSSITGLVSPAYTVLRPKIEIDGDYYRHFFKSRSFVGRLDKLIFGIRDGKQIAFRDFGDMLIPKPSLELQQKQAAIMRILESDLEIEARRLDSLKRQKRGLMQKLLTGEWRVDTDTPKFANMEKETAHG